MWLQRPRAFVLVSNLDVLEQTGQNWSIGGCSLATGDRTESYEPRNSLRVHPNPAGVGTSIILEYDHSYSLWFLHLGDV